MTPRHEELIAGFFDRALSDAEQAELLEAVRSDPETARVLADELEIHHGLRFAELPGAEGREADAERILQFIRASQDGTGFFERVKARALAEEAPARKETRHRSRRRKATGTPSRALPIGMAAALVMGIILVAALTHSGKPSSKSDAPAGVRPARDEAAHFERARLQAEERVAVIEREQGRLTEVRKKAEAEQQDELRKKTEEEFARNQAEFKAAREALDKARQEERRAKENLARETPEPKMRDTRTASFRATLERVEGQVFALSATRREAVKAGRELTAGEGLETGAIQSRAVVRFEDGTQMELGAAGTIRSFGDRAGVDGAGKHVELTRGALKADVSAQPQGQALVITTPHGEARALGTVLKIIIDPNGTRLEVIEGRVRLTRISDGQSVDVLSGQYAVAAAGAELTPWRMPPDEITINFGPATMKLPDGVWNDAGDEFDAKRGYGWKDPRGAREIAATFTVIEQATGRRYPFMPSVGKPLPAGHAYDIDPATGKPKLWRANRGTWFSQRQLVKVGPLKASGLALGWINHTETWFMPVPNGRYLVTVCVGNPDYEHGLHHVAVEGRQVVNKVMTKGGQFFEAKDMAVDVKDGELTLVVGGYGSGAVSSDGSSDTTLNYVIIRKANGK